jgi:hypothetical protein
MISPLPESRPREGFLSGRSVEYLGELINCEAELDRESVQYRYLARDVENGLTDFLQVGAVDYLNLLMLVDKNVRDEEVLMEVTR